MSTLTVTTVNTPDNNTPLYISTQNTTVGIVLHPANGTILIKAAEVITSQGKLGIGKQSFWLPISAFMPGFSAGPGNSQIETPTNQIVSRAYNFDPSTIETAQIQFKMPKHWDKGTISFAPYWTQLTTSAGAASWNVRAVAISGSEVIDSAFGTAVTVTSSGGTANTIYVGSESGPITVGGSPQEGDIIVIEVSRFATSSNDTLAIDARLLGINMFYTANNNTDS